MSSRRLECNHPSCSKTYFSTFNLKRHIEIAHLGIKRFQCGTCDKFMSSKQNLKDHQHIHTGARPYVCEVSSCGHRFRQLSQFYLHRQLHAEINAQMSRVNFVNEGILKELIRKVQERLEWKGNEVEEKKGKREFFGVVEGWEALPEIADGVREWILPRVCERFEVGE